MRRPLRSVMLCNPRYLSVYALGVAQAMGQLGHWHRTVSIFDELPDIVRQLAELSPDVIWTHMALWPPPGARTASELSEACAIWKRKGSLVFLHDGDPRDRDLTATDVAGSFTHALINRTVDVATWPIECVRWPYAAMSQAQIGEPVSEWSCELLFAGHLRRDPLYGDRTELVYKLQHALSGGMIVVCPSIGAANNRMLVADVAASAGAVLGFARPEVPGWIDTRVFQYPGAGGVLIHDDAGSFLAPGVHYLPFDREDAVESVLRAVEEAKTKGPAIRRAAFDHIQSHHTWRHRVSEALALRFG